MSCRDYELDLGDYADGTLEEPARMACETHVSSCQRCQALVADFRVIRQAARTLEPQVPGPHVWAALASTVEVERGRPGRTWGFNWQTLAASMAAVMLVASLSFVGARLTLTTAPSGQRAASAVPSAERPSVEAEIDSAETEFTTAIAGLESITNAEQSALDSDTADAFQASLVVIDGAINESRAALETEPDSPAAQDSLFEALRSKVELLQDIVALINEMRKGNPEGAARIVSGLSQ